MAGVPKQLQRGWPHRGVVADDGKLPGIGKWGCRRAVRPQVTLAEPVERIVRRPVHQHGVGRP